MNIHRFTDIKLALAAYSQFLGEKGIIFLNPESPVIPNIPALEAEFMNKLMTQIIAAGPCTAHELRLVENTKMLRIKTYRCIKCDHIEAKE